MFREMYENLGNFSDNYKKRIEECEKCNNFSHSLCNLCGCMIYFKAAFPQFNCPTGKWNNGN